MFSMFAVKGYRNIGLWREMEKEENIHNHVSDVAACHKQGEGPLNRNSLPENVGTGPL